MGNRDLRRLILEHALLAGLAGGLTWFAWWIYPAWDDGWLWLQRLEGDATIQPSMADRPLLGWIWTQLAEAGLLLPLSAVGHWAAWLGLALVTRALWRRSFPALASLGLVVAVLVLGTVVLEVQYVLVNPVWGGVLGVVLVWASALLLAPAEGVPGKRYGLRALVAACAVGVACALSEYGVVAALAVVVLLVVPTGALGSEVRAWRSAGVVGASACGGYAILLLVADPVIRTDVRPSVLFHLDIERVLATPFILLTELWQGTLGNLLRRAGEVEAESLESLVMILASALAAVAVGALVDRGSSTPERPAARRALTALIAAAAVGILAVTLTGRVASSGPTSRYYLPVTPPLLCVALWLVLRVVRSPRLVAAAVTLVAFFGTLVDFTALAAERVRVRDVAAAVRPHLHRDGLSLVVLVEPERSRFRRRADHELTATVAQVLPPVLRRRVWVVSFARLEDEGVLGVRRFRAASGARLTRSLRGFGGPTAIDRVLWVETETSGEAPRVVVTEPTRDAPR